MSKHSRPERGKIIAMKPETIEFLLNLNRDFYDTYAKSFSSTRFTIQPGIRSLVPQLLEVDSILDLGCGNGNLAKVLVDQGFKGDYLGLDNSLSLLQEAKKALPENASDRFVFRQADLSALFDTLSGQAGINVITCFAVIHHFPANPFLNQFFRFAAQTLKENGRLFLSTWQVKNNLRLRERIKPWSTFELNDSDFSEDDLLLDWRADPSQPTRFRYVHHYDSMVLRKSGLSAGLNLEDEFYSDGKEGNLALYQVWQKPST